MPETYRDRKRQEAWIKAEARRQVAQEQADALTALGVPCAVRSGRVTLLDPEGLVLTARAVSAVIDQMRRVATKVGEVDESWKALSPDQQRAALDAWRPQLPTAEATRGALPRTAPPEGDCLPQAPEAVREAHRPADDVPDFRPDDYPKPQWASEGGQG